MYETPQLRRLFHDREVTARRVMLGDGELGASAARTASSDAPNVRLGADDIAGAQPTA